MSSKTFSNKKEVAKFQLVYRSQEDPLINDADASTGVFVPLFKNARNERKIARRQDQERALKGAQMSVPLERSVATDNDTAPSLNYKSESAGSNKVTERSIKKKCRNDVRFRGASSYLW